MPTPAPAITAIPDFPSLADRTTYNAKAFAWATSLKTATAPELVALGTNIYNNAVEVAASAATLNTKASEASTSASTATTQASASSVSAAASEASRIAGSKLNLGSKTSDPALDNQGSALLTGALYFNTTSNGTRIYNGVSWQSAAGVVSPNFTILRETQTATAGQTVFNLVNSYIVGTNAVMVYINGVRQFSDAYVETNSTTITFTGPLSVGDSVLFEAGVTAVGTNVAAGNVTFSPAGGVAATNAQAAIAELGARVVAGKGANIFTGAQDYATGAALASAATVNLDTATGNRVHITGTTAITAVTLTRGPRTVIFDSVLTLTHNATTNNLPSAANIITAAGDRAIYESDGATVYCVSYVRANGAAVIASASGMTLISTVIAANSATVDVEAITGTYDKWIIVATGIRLQVQESLNARFKIGGSYVLSADYSSAQVVGTGSAPGGIGGQGQTSITNVARIAASTEANASGSFNFEVFMPASTTLAKQCMYFSTNKGDPGTFYTFRFGGGMYLGSTAALTGVRFFADTGNIVAGTFRLYGIANT